MDNNGTEQRDPDEIPSISTPEPLEYDDDEDIDRLHIDTKACVNELMDESANQTLSNGGVGVQSMTPPTNGIPEHLLVAVQSVNNSAASSTSNQASPAAVYHHGNINDVTTNIKVNIARSNNLVTSQHAIAPAPPQQPTAATPSPHLCTVQAQQPIYQQQHNQQQQVNAIVNSLQSVNPASQQGYINLTPANNNPVNNLSPYAQIATAVSQSPVCQTQAYTQLNSVALNQQMTPATQVLHTLMPTQAAHDGSANQSPQSQVTGTATPAAAYQTQQQSSTYMPQLILTAGQPIQGIQNAQMLIPTASGMVSQQILVIPVNQTTSNQMVQMVAPNGQLFTSSVANLQTLAAVQQMGSTVNIPGQQQLMQASTASNSNNYPTQQQQQTVTAPAGIVHGPVSQLVTNSAGQIIAMTAHPNIVTAQPQQINTQQTPIRTIQTQVPVTPQAINNGSQVTSLPTQQQQAQQHSLTSTTPTNISPQNQQQQQQQVTVIQDEKPCSTTNEVSTNYQPSTTTETSTVLKEECKINSCARSNSPLLAPCVSSTQQTVIQEPTSITNGDASSTTSDTESARNLYSPAPGEAALNALDGNIVDGINLEEIKDFAKTFKLRRLSLGLTQTQVGEALSAAEGPAYSQSAICRFEKLDITPKSALRIKPVLEHWLSEAEERYKSGNENLTEYITESSKKRKRRTSFTPQALDLLNAFFKKNTHPTGSEMTALASSLNYDREVVRVWFCNKRQALKNTIKRLRTEA